ncbi:hypothetical protein UlMin_014862 [Ulmus minor]
MMAMAEMWSQMGSIMATIMFVYAIIQQYLSYQFRSYFERYTNKVVSLVYPYIQITFHEYTGDRFKRSERLKAHDLKDSKSLVLSLDDNEEVTDEFNGVKLWWTSYKSSPKADSFSFYPTSDEKRFYKLKFHRQHRDLITQSYLHHVVTEGKGIAVKNRQRKLYTNGSNESWYGSKRTKWTHVHFEHPATFCGNKATFDELDLMKILNDLLKFKKGKEYYAKFGKPWKCGYLLYGPPGTGKSTMIAAMANFLDYDVYDLELTAVNDNTDLKKLLIDTSNRSIIVIEDIDCSLDLTGQRKKEKEKEKDEDEEKKDPMRKRAQGEEKKSKVTLSGLLNFIDGIWSACGGERLIVFTTNYHVEMSYCCFETFKVLAKNYLDTESHHLFQPIEVLLGETNMSPADVAENLMPKSDTEDVETCLKSLIEALEKAKEEAKEKAEEEAKAKAEEEAKLKGEEKAKEDEKLVKENGHCNGREEVKCNCKCNGKSGSDEVKENGGVTA